MIQKKDKSLFESERVSPQRNPGGRLVQNPNDIQDSIDLQDAKDKNIQLTMDLAAQRRAAKGEAQPGKPQESNGDRGDGPETKRSSKGAWDITGHRALVGRYRDWEGRLEDPKNFEIAQALEGGFKEADMPLRVGKKGGILNKDCTDFGVEIDASASTFTNYTGSYYALYKEFDAPAKGSLTRVKLAVRTAATGATNGRIVVSKRRLLTSTGVSMAGSMLEFLTARKHHVYDTDSNGTPSKSLAAAGVPLDRIFDSPLDYENKDDDTKTYVAGLENPQTNKENKLYVLFIADGNITAGIFDIAIETEEVA